MADVAVDIFSGDHAYTWKIMIRALA